MEDIQSTLQALGLHPMVDHFTVALITVAVLADLCASLFSQRAWFRYMALTLTVLAAGCAVASEYTGALEARRVKDTLTGPAKTLLHNHAQLGEILAYVLVGLAVTRIAFALFGFLSRVRPLYLILAVGTVAVVFWQGHWGEQLVFDYGVGTQPGAAAMSKAKQALEGATDGSMRAIPTPRIETPMARPTLPPAASSPAPAPGPSKAAASPAPAKPAGPTPAPSSPTSALTPQPAPSASAPTATSGAASPPAGSPTPSASSTGAPGPSGAPSASR